MNFQDYLIHTILEAHAAYIDTGAPNYDPYAGPIARRYGKTRMKKRPKIKDPVVKSGVSDAVKRLNKKLGGTKSNPQVQHMVQSALLKRRKRRGGLRLPQLSKKESAAEWQDDIKKRSGDR